MRCGTPVNGLPRAGRTSASLWSVVPDGRRARYPARHITVCIERRSDDLNLGGTADSLEFVPKQSFITLFGAFSFSPQEALCTHTEKADGDGDVNRFTVYTIKIRFYHKGE